MFCNWPQILTYFFHNSNICILYCVSQDPGRFFWTHIYSFLRQVPIRIVLVVVVTFVWKFWEGAWHWKQVKSGINKSNFDAQCRPTFALENDNIFLSLIYSDERVFDQLKSTTLPIFNLGKSNFQCIINSSWAEEKSSCEWESTFSESSNTFQSQTNSF